MRQSMLDRQTHSLVVDPSASARSCASVAWSATSSPVRLGTVRPRSSTRSGSRNHSWLMIASRAKPLGCSGLRSRRSCFPNRNPPRQGPPRPRERLRPEREPLAKEGAEILVEVNTVAKAEGAIRENIVEFGIKESLSQRSIDAQVDTR